MSCHRFGDAVVCVPNIYKYKGFIFEFHAFCGPMRLKKDLEPSKIAGDKFYEVVTEWVKLDDLGKESTRIYG